MIFRGVHRWVCFAILTALLAGWGSGLGEPAQATRNPVSAAAAITDPQPLTPQEKARLQGYIRAATLPDLRWLDFQKYQPAVKKFYDSTGGDLAWVRDLKPSPQARAIIALLENAESDGLRPEDYDGPRWDERLAMFEHRAPSGDELVRFDLAVTISAMRYVTALHNGRVDPRLLRFEIGIHRKKFDVSDFLRRKVVNAQDVRAAVESAGPSFPAYRRTLAALKTYLELARQDNRKPLPVPRRTIDPGDQYAGLPSLVRLLVLLGDLPKAAENQGSGLTYEGDLVEGVKHFQERHGLEVDGRIGRRTLRALNTPLSRRVAQLQLTLERWRWMPHGLAPPLIVVNIPEFRLHALDKEYHEVLSMKVVVGKAYRHKTPVFVSTLTSVILRPYWNVPLSIQLRELLPDIRKNPSYLTENDYEVVDSAKDVVSEGPVSSEIMEQLRTGALSIRQRPGSKNALGLIKFEFPNQFSVYMHGTPAMVLFSKSRRDFSHGCIRVEDPVALALWALHEKPEWDLEHIQAAMDGEDTIRANPKKSINVLIVYSTAVATEEGEAHFFNDIYGYDAALEQALREEYPYPR
jgi:murein L,D-transpeptidase YcbB/YkuD